MKKSICYLLMLMLGMVVYTSKAQQYILRAPTKDKNYIITRTFKVAGINLSNLNDSRNVSEENQMIQYFDGFGRLLQNVIIQGSPGFGDVIHPISYDVLGRTDRTYLPYTSQSNGGAYRSNALQPGNGLFSFYALPPAGVKANPSPFGRTVFEQNPLNRIEQEGAAGTDWQPENGHAKRMSYGVNAANEVKLWTPGVNSASATSYAAGALSKSILKDENWVPAYLKASTVEEFKDKEGRVVLKRLWETDIKSLSTYYVYDDFGNLRYVLPPAVNENELNINSFSENDVAFKNFVYCYYYDDRDRVTRKKIPGKEWEYFVYNKLDQLVLTQDGVQRSKANQIWTATKYDAFGRIIITSIHTYGAVANTNYLAEVQGLVDAQANQWEIKDPAPTGIGYTINRTYPTVVLNSILSIQYYDDYTAPGMPAAYNQSDNTAYSRMTKGLPTASQINVLGTINRLWTVNYYDDEARIIKTYKQHYQSGVVNAVNYDEISNVYSFAGELLSSKREHRVGATTTTIANTYEYDHVGRKKLVKEKINAGAEVVLSKLSYNEIGQLLKKELHSTDNGTTFLQKTEYAYNERGWLKTGTSNEFSIKLKYQDGTTPQYNGNISNQDWGAGSTFPNVYTYGYDKLNRLTTAASTGVKMSEVLTYDVMGNIKSMNRDAAAAASIYNYTGNQLNNITLGALATAANYVYDVNGNATKDGRNGLTLTYNLLNLPATAIKTTPVPAVNLTYTYDATGNKLRKVSSVAPIGTRHYVDGIEYNGNLIDVIRTEEGLARNNGGVYSYEYNLTDHLGNVRYSFNKHPTTLALQKLQVDDYYAFGLRKKSVAASNDNKYLYNGKELQEELGQLDYGARFYDPVIGRWNIIDPLAEGTDDLSPYNYAMNNPILMIDPDGLSADTSKLIDKIIQLVTVDIHATKKVKVLEPVDGFWSRLWYSRINGGRDAQYNGYTVSADADGYAFPTPKAIQLTAPDIGIKGGFNTVYKGIKKGLPYIGKAFNVFKRYNKAERLLMEIEPVLNGIGDPKLLRAVEQKVLEYSKSKAAVANIRNAFDPKRSDYAEYSQKAVVWLEKNAPNWKESF